MAPDVALVITSMTPATYQKVICRSLAPLSHEFLHKALDFFVLAAYIFSKWAKYKALVNTVYEYRLSVLCDSLKYWQHFLTHHNRSVSGGSVWKTPQIDLLAYSCLQLRTILLRVSHLVFIELRKHANRVSLTRRIEASFFLTNPLNSSLRM